MGDRVERGEALGRAVERRRWRELGLSREALATLLGWRSGSPEARDRSGWSPRTIVRIERGQRGLRSDAEVNALAASLDLTARALMMRISEARDPGPGEGTDELAEQIARIDDPGARKLLERIASDLERVARELGREGRGG
jgi:transcriptional regulator with XRE-family HTH domain